jgi:hypothetical protein
MTDGPDSRPETPAEERLLVSLEGLREHPPEPGVELVTAVLRTARWQALVRPYMATAGTLAGAFAAGVQLLAGAKERR